MDGSCAHRCIADQNFQAASSNIAPKASTSKQILPWEVRPSGHANQPESTEGEYKFFPSQSHYNLTLISTDGTTAATFKYVNPFDVWSVSH